MKCMCGALDCVACYGKEAVRLYLMAKGNKPMIKKQCACCPKILMDDEEIGDEFYSRLVDDYIYLCFACSDNQRKAMDAWLSASDNT